MREGTHHRAPTGEDVYVAGKLAGAMEGDTARLIPRAIQDLHRAVQHNVEPPAAFSRSEERLTISKTSARAA